MGGSASKVDDVTALPNRHKMVDMCYYSNVMTTTRWWLCVTILHLQQYSHRRNLFFLSSHLPLGFPTGPFPSGFPNKTVYAFFFPPFLPHGRPISSSFINQTKHVQSAVPIMKLLITQFSWVSCHFLPFSSQLSSAPYCP